MTDLINTVETPGEFDALTKLRPDEPYFPLVGRDRLAPPLVQAWADANRDRALKEFGEGKIDEEKRDRELRKSTQAEAIGWAMTSYKAGDMAKKVLGEPTAKPYYSGHELPEETKRRDALQSCRARSAAALHNAIAELTDLAPLMDANEERNLDGDDVLGMVSILKRLADDIAPKRQGIPA